MKTPPTVATPSLRALARKVGCTHSTLSERIHDGSLTVGVGLDEHGRAFVHDLDAAAAQYNGLDARRAAELIQLDDPTLGCRRYAVDVFVERDALNALAVALISIALGATCGPVDPSKVKALRERVSTQLRAVRELIGADDDVLEQAEDELNITLGVLEEPPEPGEEPVL